MSCYSLPLPPPQKVSAQCNIIVIIRRNCGLVLASTGLMASFVRVFVYHRTLIVCQWDTEARQGPAKGPPGRGRQGIDRPLACAWQLIEVASGDPIGQDRIRRPAPRWAEPYILWSVQGASICGKRPYGSLTGGILCRILALLRQLGEPSFPTTRSPAPIGSHLSPGVTQHRWGSAP